jgi:hypothetical protein
MGFRAPSRVRIPPSPLPVPRPDRTTSGPGLDWDVAAPVAQLDRASVYGTEGQRFESSRARHENPAKRGVFAFPGSATFRPGPRTRIMSSRICSTSGSPMRSSRASIRSSTATGAGHRRAAWPERPQAPLPLADRQRELRQRPHRRDVRDRQQAHQPFRGLGLVTEITGRRRSRRFSYEPYLRLFHRRCGPRRSPGAGHQRLAHHAAAKQPPLPQPRGRRPSGESGCWIWLSIALHLMLRRCRGCVPYLLA